MIEIQPASSGAEFNEDFMTEDIQKKLPYELISESIGTRIKIISNTFHEIPGQHDEVHSSHRITFLVKEDAPDKSAIGILFTLSLMSFAHATPRDYSENVYNIDEQWNLGYFIQCLEFEGGHLRFYGDYVSGRMMKTEIIYETGGKVEIITFNRGKSADRWISHLQGKSHVRVVKK